MATEADINLAREMFNVFATGFDPGETGINFWADKIANQGYESTLQEFLNPAQGASAPRSTIMFADPEYRLATGTTDTAGMSDEQFRQAMGLVGQQNRAELDSSLRSWYDTYTGGRGMSTPVDAYVSMLNGRDGTYLSRDYEAAKQKMLDDAVKAGLYGGPDIRYSTGAYESWLRQQTANNAVTGPGAGGGAGGGGTATTQVIVYGPDGTAYSNPAAAIAAGVRNYTTTPPAGKGAADLFSLYATNFVPDQTALDFWNNKIQTLGYDRALQEFLRPSDVNAPRNQSMFADPDYVAWANANGYTIPGTTPGGTTPGGTTPGGGFAPGPSGGEVPAGMARFGGLNFFGTPIQQGFYSERGFEPNAVPFGQMAPGVGDAQALFNTYATGFAPDQTALDFWNNKIATLGYQGALQQFLNPSDVNAPRNATMFQDPDYAFGRSQFAAGFTPPSPMPMATFRSGVSGYTPMVPTGFQFGVQDVLAPRVVFQPGAFDPGMVNAEGTWMPTLAFNQQQQNSIIAQQQAQAEDSGGD